MWSDYSARAAAELVGLSESAVRSCVRDGFLSASVDAVPVRFSFQDLRLLKLVKSLCNEGAPLRRVRRSMRSLRSRTDREVSLSSLPLVVHNGHLVVRDGERMWRADSGQLVFDFFALPPEGDVAPLPLEPKVPGPEAVAALTAEEWFDLAIECEEDEPAQAISAYRQCLKLRPDSTEVLINLGRLCAETGDKREAADCFRLALECDPSDATGYYNLGVVEQDFGNDDRAAELYRHALRLDTGLAEAHYNLATIYDRTGDPKSAIRHINEYRKLTRDS